VKLTAQAQALLARSQKITTSSSSSSLPSTTSSSSFLPSIPHRDLSSEHAAFSAMLVQTEQDNLKQRKLDAITLQKWRKKEEEEREK
jgi:hypothetical protein